MELKEYVKIFVKDGKIFFGVVVAFLFVGSFFQILRPLSWKANLGLNVTRAGSQQTVDYTYDDFYRLQADERFADTVVRWLGSPRVVAEIYHFGEVKNERRKNLLDLFPGDFRARRLSSQFIEVEYVARDKQTAEKLADALIKVVNREAQVLNQAQKESQWFMVLGDKPVITPNVFSWPKAMIFSLLFGIFSAFWTVMLRHYFSEN